MKRFLLVGNPRQSWLSVLKDAVKPLGELDVCGEAETFAQMSKMEYNVVIVDGGEVDNAEDIVFRLRSQTPLLHIIVVTAAGTWQFARRVLLAGASDYINKYADKKRLSAFLVDILDRPPSAASLSTR